MEAVREKFKILIGPEEIKERVNELAEKINLDFKNKRVSFIIVLRGGIFFAVDLLKKIDLICEIDFIEISSYDNSLTSSGKVVLVKDIKNKIKDTHVIILEDIIDTGVSLRFLKEHLKKYEPMDINTCVLLDKHENRVENIEPDYIGFVIPNRYVIGYGMDYKNYFRNLDRVVYLED